MAPASLADFFGFLLSVQAKVTVVLQTGCDHFIPCPFQFIMHQPVNFLMMDSDTNTVEWLHSSHFVYSVL
jgi:hypothetical protein